MTQAAAEQGRVDRLDADLIAVRERLARVEANLEAHEKATDARHRATGAQRRWAKARAERGTVRLLDAVEALGERVGQVDARAWKLALALAALGLGGAGAGELLRAAIGG